MNKIKKYFLILVIVPFIIGGFFKPSLANNNECSILYYSLDDFSKIDICKNEITVSKLFSVPYHFSIDDAKISKDCEKIVFDLCEYNKTLSGSNEEYIHSLWLLDLGKSDFIKLSPESSEIKNINFYLPDNENIIIFSFEENNHSLIYTIDYDGVNLKRITPLYQNAVIEWIEVSQRNKRLIYAVKGEHR